MGERDVEDSLEEAGAGRTGNGGRAPCPETLQHRQLSGLGNARTPADRASAVRGTGGTSENEQKETPCLESLNSRPFRPHCLTCDLHISSDSLFKSLPASFPL